MHQTATAGFQGNKDDYNNDPELDKSVRVLHILWRSGTEMRMFLKGDSEGLTIPSGKGGPLESNVLGVGQIVTTGS